MDYIKRFDTNNIKIPVDSTNTNNSDKIFGMSLTNILCIGVIIALIVVLIICIVKKYTSSNETMKDTRENNDNSNNDNDNISNDSGVHMIMIDRVGCPFSDKMRKIVEDNKMKIGNNDVDIVDINSNRGKQICSKYGISGTPTFVCLKTGKISVGFKPLDEHLNTLTKEDDSEKDKSNSDYIVVGYMGCPFTKKMVDYLNSKNVSHSFVESKSDEGKKQMENHKANGVPLTINTKTKNHKVGYSEDLP